MVGVTAIHQSNILYYFSQVEDSESTEDDESNAQNSALEGEFCRAEGLFDARGNVMEVHLKHSLCPSSDKSPQSREDEMGITIQFLAEENVKLLRANKELNDQLKQLKKEHTDSSGWCSERLFTRTANRP